MEVEAAHELAETLIQDHRPLMSDGLGAELSSFVNDLAVMIDSHYGISDDTGAEV